MLLSYLSHLRFVDFVDVLVVAWIIYRFLIIVQGTRASQMIFGLVALAALWGVSSVYEMYALSWLLHIFFDYLFIIIIVLFQDQIRSALVSLSGAKLFNRSGRVFIDSQIEEVIEAAMVLSREKVGALIVFEKDHGLLNYSSTGTRLDAKLHSDVIYSLFQNKSPLHDGAIIIFNGLIQSAGCLLPLSKNIDLDRHYGTRHRAALGITEVSDAVVVTVSEETGKVNVVYDGQFHPAESEEMLRKTLRKFLLEIKTSKSAEAQAMGVV